MSDALRLTPADRVMIHALALLSRPGITDASRENLSMVVGILGEVIPHLSRDHRLIPLVVLARDFVSAAPLRPGYYGPLHDRASREMNRFDGQCMAASWDRIREGVA